jgi:hypothetical protein
LTASAQDNPPESRESHLDEWARFECHRQSETVVRERLFPAPGLNVSGRAKHFQGLHKGRSARLALVAFHAMKSVENYLTDDSEGIDDFFNFVLRWHVVSSFNL